MGGPRAPKSTPSPVPKRENLGLLQNFDFRESLGALWSHFGYLFEGFGESFRGLLRMFWEDFHEIWEVWAACLQTGPTLFSF